MGTRNSKVGIGLSSLAAKVPFGSLGVVEHSKTPNVDLHSSDTHAVLATCGVDAPTRGLGKTLPHAHDWKQPQDLGDSSVNP